MHNDITQAPCIMRNLLEPTCVFSNSNSRIDNFFIFSLIFKGLIRDKLNGDTCNIGQENNYFILLRIRRKQTKTHELRGVQ